MEYLVTYDVTTLDRDGQRRLRKVANVCEAFGYRVQKSVFEVFIHPRDLPLLIADLSEAIDDADDSIRIYQLGRPGQTTIWRLGTARHESHRGTLET